MHPLSRFVLSLATMAAILATAWPGVATAQQTTGSTAGSGDALAEYNTVVTLYKQSRWDLAARTSRRFLEAHPQHPKAPLAMLYLGQSLSQQEQYTEAREVFRGFLQKYPGTPEQRLAQYRIGEASHFLGDHAAAVPAFTKYLAGAQPGDLTNYARLYLGESLAALDRHRDALDPLEALLRTEGLNRRLQVDARLQLARSLGELDRTDEAIGQLNRILADAPNAARIDDVRMTLGSLLFGAGRYAEAQAAFDSLVAATPGSSLVPAATLNAGNAAYRSGKFDVALQRFDKAAKTDSQRPLANYWAGLSLKASGQTERAADRFLQQYTATPDDALADRLLFQAAEALARSGKAAEARTRYLEVVDRFPEGLVADDSLLAATRLAIEDGDLAAARELSDRFEQTFPSSPLAPRQTLLAARITLAELARDPNRQLDAATAARLEARLRAVLGEGGSLEPVARLGLARLLRQRGQGEEALAVLSPLLENTAAPASVLDEARLLAGSLHLDAGRAPEAAAILQTVTATSEPVAALLLARAEAEQKRWDAAEAALRRLPPLPESPADAAGEGPSRDERAGTLLDLAEMAFSAAEYEAAARWFAQSAALDLNEASRERRLPALSGLGFSLRELGRHADAAATFGELAPLADGNAPLQSLAMYMEALSQQAAGNVDEARRLYRKGVETFAAGNETPANGDEKIETAFNGYRLAKGAARLAYEAGDIEAAALDYARASQQLQRLPAPRQVDLEYLLDEWGQVLLEAERFDDSDAVYRDLLRLRPESDFADDARLYLAESSFFGDQPGEAREPLDALMSDDAADEAIRRRAGELLLDLLAEGDDAAAVQDAATRYLAAFPNSPERAYAQYRQAEALLKLDRPEDAEPLLQGLVGDAAVAGPQPADWGDSVPVLLAEALVRQRKYDEAEAAATAFASRRPDSPLGPQVDEIIGRSLKNRARFAEARERLRRVTTDPRSRRTETAAKAQLLIADTYLLEEKWDDALTAYFTVYANYAFPEYQAPALLQAARCDEQMGNFKDALATYDLVLKEFAETPQAAEARTARAATAKRLGQ